MDPVKVTGICDWPIPTGLRQLRGFLGFANFYRCFIGHFSDIVAPLTRLTKKDQPWNWTNECQLVFDTLKQKFLEEPCLLMPDMSKPFQIEADASLHATAGVL